MLNNMMNAPRRNFSQGNLSCFVQGKGRVWLMRKATILTLAAAAAIGAAGNASAAILYSTAGSVYSENFNDSLPTDDESVQRHGDPVQRRSSHPEWKRTVDRRLEG